MCPHNMSDLGKMHESWRVKIKYSMLFSRKEPGRATHLHASLIDGACKVKTEAKMLSNCRQNVDV